LRLIVTVSHVSMGGHFHGTVRGGHFHRPTAGHRFDLWSA
jgi:hypothetical protein